MTGPLGSVNFVLSPRTKVPVPGKQFQSYGKISIIHKLHINGFRFVPRKICKDDITHKKMVQTDLPWVYTIWVLHFCLQKYAKQNILPKCTKYKVSTMTTSASSILPWTSQHNFTRIVILEDTKRRKCYHLTISPLLSTNNFNIIHSVLKSTHTKEKQT